MKYFLFLSLWLLVSCQWSLKKKEGIENAPQHLNRPYVLLISIDGYRYDYTSRFKPPALNKFIQKGVYAEGLIPIFPSITFPNHYAIATGLRADKHGIVANTFWDSSRGELYELTNRRHVEDGRWYRGEPLWVAATKQQMVAASYFWVGSEADIQGIRPNYWFRYDGATPKSKKVQQVLDWFQLPPEKRPHLVMLYFPEVDKAGHLFGPESAETRASVLGLDQDLGILFEGLEKLDMDMDVNVVIVSDHGMQESPPSKTLYLSDYITLNEKIRVEGRGTHYLFYISDPVEREKAYHQLKKIPKARVYKRGEFPPSYGYNQLERIGDLVLSVSSPYYIKKGRSGKIRKKRGTHGYDPALNKNMQGIFYARGPQVANKGKIPAFENIHVYPFVMDLLGLEIRTLIDGDPSVLAPYRK